MKNIKFYYPWNNKKIEDKNNVKKEKKLDSQDNDYNKLFFIFFMRKKEKI